ncbi:hypothetical protein BO85DRAFT_274718 [Aspergillus piperis CBS 112811]|uniref:Uncharacterized protein n=1 Tax=Aspergillus piperis CBS 112811 TaxID=1448313 RepID=A0A8G1VQ59_9EURO|nr:hypothetical protein BO85DRAFT_274718 [Aspergillus piperis CBS 112811]RAH58418.1 hypothetical protein BO85DRAFT_274718 [Aspergillus piperis CBS 112811]
MSAVRLSARGWASIDQGEKPASVAGRVARGLFGSVGRDQKSYKDQVRSRILVSQSDLNSSSKDTFQSKQLSQPTSKTKAKPQSSSSKDTFLFILSSFHYETIYSLLFSTLGHHVPPHGSCSWRSYRDKVQPSPTRLRELAGLLGLQHRNGPVHRRDPLCAGARTDRCR